MVFVYMSYQSAVVVIKYNYIFHDIYNDQISAIVSMYALYDDMNFPSWLFNFQNSYISTA